MEPKALMERLKDKITPKLDYQSVIDAGVPFRDEDFPPDVISLISLSQLQLSPKKADLFSSLTWAKPAVLFGGPMNYEMFGDIRPSRIRQGSLGDCYFLSAVSALAEFPERIRSIFLTKFVNAAGCYALQVYVAGHLRTIVLDDYIPCIPGTRHPAFTQSVGHELWVLLLEKAWAKANDNYQNIESGGPEEALSFLTGAPCVTLWHEQEEDGTEAIWQKILQANSNNYMICAGAGGVHGTLESEYDQVGIQTNHAYSVLKAREIAEGGTVRILQLRNPWGAQDWVGDWSDVSPLWTPELKRRLHFEGKDVGTFFISFEDFIRYFSYTVVCKFSESYFSQCFEVLQPLDSFNVFAFRVDSIVMGHITVHQLEKRFVREKHEDYEYSPVCALLARVNLDGTLKCIGHGSEYKGSVSTIDMTLTPGTYVLYVRVEWTQPFIHEYCINTYTSAKVDFGRLEHCREFPLVAEIIRDFCREHPEKLHPFNPSYPALQLHCAISRSLGHAFEYYYNSSLTYGTPLIIDIKSTPTAQSMRLVYPQAVPPVVISLLPGRDALVLHRMLNMECSIQFLYSAVFNPAQGWEQAGPAPPDEEFVGLLFSGLEYAFEHSPVLAAVRGPIEFAKNDSSVLMAAVGPVARVAAEEQKSRNSPERRREESVPKFHEELKENVAAAAAAEPRREEKRVSTCAKGHKLTLSGSDMSPSAQFQCNNCRSISPCSIGVWTCDPCRFAVCPLCYLEPQDSARHPNWRELGEATELTCNKMHRLALTGSAEGYRNSVFCCDICRCMRKCADKRLCCLRCRFDVCNECRPALELSLQRGKQHSSFYARSPRHKSALPTEAVIRIVLERHIQFLGVADLLSLLCVQKKLAESTIHPVLSRNLKPLLAMVLRNGQNQFRKWLHRRLVPGLPTISASAKEEYYVAYTNTANLVRNSSGKEGFDHWALEPRKEFAWTIEDDWVHLSQYRKEHLTFCGSATECKVTQQLSLGPAQKIIDNFAGGLGCYVLGGAYVSRRTTTPCEVTIYVAFYDAEGRSIDYRIKTVRPAQSCQGEYKYVEIRMDDQMVLAKTARIELSFWTKVLVPGQQGWCGARVTDVFFRVIPNEYVC